MSLEPGFEKVGLAIPTEIVEATHMSVSELKQEIAVMLFQKEKLTVGQASEFSGMSRYQFQHLLAGKRIPLHYDTADFEDDIKTLGEIEDL